MASAITALLPEEDKKNRFLVYLDGVLWFSLHRDTVMKLKLTIGPIDSIENLKQKILFHEKEQAMEQLSRFLKFRRRSKVEVSRRLERYGYSEEVIKLVIGTLERAGLLDDWQFAQWWVKEGIRSGKKGRTRLKSELLIRGVDEKITEEVLQNLYNEEGDFERARALASKRYHIMVKLQKDKAKSKLVNFLTRKGFSYNTAMEVWRSLKNDK